MNVVFVGISDPFISQAERVLSIRRQESNPNKHKWAGTKVFSSSDQMLASVSVDCVFIGVPPNAHGCDEKPLELQCINANANVFIEKPISCASPEHMQNFKDQLCAAEAHGSILSVAYMFRYSKAIQEIKKLVEMFGPVKYFGARYNCAYSKINKISWWDNAQSGGPIVEQATHFVDVARYLVGDLHLPSVTAMSVKATDLVAGELNSVPIDEQSVPPAHRVPRVTTAMWKFASGAVGSLTHSALLHGWNYETHFEVSGDGYLIRLSDPYGKNEITFRGPEDEVERHMSVPNDPYWEEIEAFVEAVRNKDPSKIASSYADAFKTYEATWAIRRAAEANTF